MDWFNWYGLIIMVVIMIPNVVFAVAHKGNGENASHHRAFGVTEQIGRYGCFVLMIFNIPFTWFGFWFDGALTVYPVTDGILAALYCLGWLLFWNKNNLAKALVLSVLPSVIFIFSGIILLNVPLLVFAVIFAVGHITVSCRNVLCMENTN